MLVFADSGFLALRPRNAARRLYVLRPDIDILSMSKPALHNEIIAWNFELEFRFHKRGIFKFDSRACVRKIDNGTR